jgi:hypothetical protein
MHIMHQIKRREIHTTIKHIHTRLQTKKNIGAGPALACVAATSRRLVRAGKEETPAQMAVTNLFSPIKEHRCILSAHARESFRAIANGGL